MRSEPRHCAIAFLVALALLSASAAAAQDAGAAGDGDTGTQAANTPAPDDERARLHFEAGRSYFDEGAYEDALREFQSAYRQSPRTAMLFNLGTTYERLNRLEEAADTFEQFLAESDRAAEFPALPRRIANLRRRAREGGAASAGAPAAPSHGPNGLTVAGGVMLGLGGAAFVSFGVLGGLALAEHSSLEEGCFAAGGCNESEVSTLRDLTLGADISWATAAVATAAGATLLIIGLLSDDGSSDTATRLTPVLSPGAAGLLVTGAMQ